MKKVFKTSCDMGSIKIFTKDVSLFFTNEVGDGTNTVHISTKNRGYKTNKYKFLGHFSVKVDDTVSLSSYDCSDDGIYKFGKGRWFVYLDQNTGVDFYIEYQDGDVHA